MKTKLVNRYYCDFCKKANCSAASIRRHEKGCTNNPNRVCGMCKIIGNEQSQMTDLIAAANEDAKPLLDEYEAFPYGALTAEFEVWLAKKAPTTKLRFSADGCPACMFAAIRQSNLDVQFDFDWKTEQEEFWKQFNSDEDKECRHG